MRCASPPESVGAGAAEREVVRGRRRPGTCSAVRDLAEQLAGDLSSRWRRASSSSTCATSSPSGSAADLVERAVAEAHGRRVVAQPAAAALEQSTSPTKCSSCSRRARRESRGFFEGGVEAFELEAERAERVLLRLSDAFGLRTCGLRPSIHCFARAVQHRSAAAAAKSRSNGTSSGTPGAAAEGGEHRAGERLAADSATERARPSASVSFGSRSSAAGFAPVCVPRPSHAGHQPSELLNEKLCGVSGSKLRPHLSQARCWLWTRPCQRGFGHVVVRDGRRAPRPCPARARSRRCRRCASGRPAARRCGRSPLRPRACGGGRSSAASSSECVSPSIRTRT